MDCKKKVYIASPYSVGDKSSNVRRQIAAGDVLMSNGFTPFLPLLSHYQNEMLPRPETDWLANDLEWVDACDVLVRLDGQSIGADTEVQYAVTNGIPVYYGLEDLLHNINLKKDEADNS